MTQSPVETPGLLEPGVNCWRVETAGRVAFLMENDAYFDALSQALDKARRQYEREAPLAKRGFVAGRQFEPGAIQYLPMADGVFV